MNKKIINKTFIKTGLTILILILTIYGVVQATPPAAPYMPGQTLNPACAPGTPNCTIIAPAVSTRVLTAGAGLTGGGNLIADRTFDIGAGTGILVGPDSIAVIYGSTAGTAVEGNRTITITPGTNLSRGGTITLGAGGTLTLATIPNPVFTTSVTTPLLTTAAGDLTLDAFGNLVIADSIIALTGASPITFQRNTTLADILALDNIGAGGTLSLNLADGGLRTAGTERLTNAGALINIASLNTHAIPAGTGTLAVSATAPITLSAAGAIGVQRADLLGTPNRVIVTGGTGVLLGTAPATLSLPQDIHTGATPQFARMGLGVAADGTALLNLGGALVHGTAAGNVGIGTVAPRARLDVLGGDIITGLTNEQWIFHSGGGGAFLHITDQDAGGGWKWGQGLTIHQDGNIGIGMVAPTERLHVAGNILGTGWLRVADGTALAPTFSFSADPDVGIFRQAADVIGFTTAGVERARIAATGLDIRTGGLLVAGTEIITPGRLIRTADGTAAAPAFSFSTDTGVGLFRPAISTLAFTTAGAERMRIDAAGNVGIGTAAPEARLDVVGTSKLGTFGTIFTHLQHGMVSIDPPSIGAGTSVTVTAIISGIAVGDRIFLTPPSDIHADLIYQGATITAVNTITIRMRNLGTVAVDDITRSWAFKIIRP